MFTCFDWSVYVGVGGGGGGGRNLCWENFWPDPIAVIFGNKICINYVTKCYQWKNPYSSSLNQETRETSNFIEESLTYNTDKHVYDMLYSLFACSLSFGDLKCFID